MVRRSIVRGVAAFSLLGLGAAVSTTALHAQPGRRSAASRLQDFPEAQAALAAAQVDETGALNSMLTTLETGTVTFYFSTSRLRADQDARTALVRTLGASLPRIVESQMFRDMYARVRDEAATRTIGPAPDDPSVARADMVTQAQLSLRELEQQRAAPGLDRRTRSSLDEAIEQARANIARLQRSSGDTAMQASERAQFEAARAEYEARRTAAQAELETRLPADVRQLVANRLSEFVAGCRDVNFRARTRTMTNGQVVFADAPNEARPKLWKLCFRAGQRTVTEARRVATTWLGQLQRAGIRPRNP